MRLLGRAISGCGKPKCWRRTHAPCLKGQQSPTILGCGSIRNVETRLASLLTCYFCLNESEWLQEKRWTDQWSLRTAATALHLRRRPHGVFAQSLSLTVAVVEPDSPRSDVSIDHRPESGTPQSPRMLFKYIPLIWQDKPPSGCIDPPSVWDPSTSRFYDALCFSGSPLSYGSCCRWFSGRLQSAVYIYVYVYDSEYNNFLNRIV